jgi:hypothetical protein
MHPHMRTQRSETVLTPALSHLCALFAPLFNGIPF